jgi:hypothetical protein
MLEAINTGLENTINSSSLTQKASHVDRTTERTSILKTIVFFAGIGKLSKNLLI